MFIIDMTTETRAGVFSLPRGGWRRNGKREWRPTEKPLRPVATQAVAGTRSTSTMAVAAAFAEMDYGDRGRRGAK
jgi:hypothetical protein